MKLYPRDSNKPETLEEVTKALLQLVEENLEIKRWSFDLVFSKFIKPNNFKLIYNSEWCRVKFMFSRMHFPESDKLLVEYGRLHAPDEEPFMVWEDERCRCWHSVLDPLRFLDLKLAVPGDDLSQTDNQLPFVVKDFRKSKLSKKLMNEYPPKATLALQSALWSHYGESLFELFDLRQPDLWEEYRQFLKEYYRSLDLKSSYGPPLYSVC